MGDPTGTFRSADTTAFSELNDRCMGAIQEHAIKVNHYISYRRWVRIGKVLSAPYTLENKPPSHDGLWAYGRVAWKVLPNLRQSGSQTPERG